MNNFTRRDFVKAAAVSAAAVSTFNILGAQAAAGINTSKIKVGLIGCGGRGTGALDNFKEAAKLLGIEVEVVAVADAFKDKVSRPVSTASLKSLSQSIQRVRERSSKSGNSLSPRVSLLLPVRSVAIRRTTSIWSLR